MTKEEFTDCIRLLRKYYSRALLFKDTDAVDQWYEDLKLLPHLLVGTVIKAWANKHAFPPSLAELQDYAKRVLHWIDVQEIIQHDTNGKVSHWNTAEERLQWGCREYLRQLTGNDHRGS